MDLIQFLKEIQYFDVMLSPYCLEVQSQQIQSMENEDIADDSIVLALDQRGNPINPYKGSDKNINFENKGKVLTTIILQIPSYSK